MHYVDDGPMQVSVLMQSPPRTRRTQWPLKVRAASDNVSNAIICSMPVNDSFSNANPDARKHRLTLSVGPLDVLAWAGAGSLTVHLEPRAGLDGTAL